MANLMARLVVFLWLFWLFYGPTAHLQNALFGSLFFDEGGMKVVGAAIMVLFVTYMSWHGRQLKVTDVTVLTTFFLFLTMILSPLAFFALDASADHGAPIDVWYALLKTYAMISLFIVADALRWRMTDEIARRISRTIYFVYLPFFILAAYQFIANSPVLPVVFPGSAGDEPGKLFVYGGFFMGEQLRAFSFTNSPLDFGIMSLFVLVLSLFNALKGGPIRSEALIIVCLSAVGVGLTLTRSLALNAVLGVFIVFMLAVGPRPGLRQVVRYYPYICVGLIASLLVLASLLPGLSALDRSYLDSESLFARVNYWVKLVEKLSMNLPQILYGNGEPQARGADTGIVYDNTAVAILMMSGMPALIFFILLYDRIYVRTLTSFYAAHPGGRRQFLGGALAFFACYPGLSMFNNLIQGAILFFIPALLARRDNDSRYENRGAPAPSGEWAR